MALGVPMRRLPQAERPSFHLLQVLDGLAGQFSREKNGEKR